jgi:hypothetical protein
MKVVSLKAKLGIKLRNTRYYLKNRDKVLAKSKTYSQTNRLKVYENQKRRRLERTNSWIGIVPLETTCEICGKKLYFKGHPRHQTIHFDHKSPNLPIKTKPSKFVMGKFCNTANKALWLSCNFGYLCSVCNRALPTKNRKEWLTKAYAYTQKV